MVALGLTEETGPQKPGNTDRPGEARNMHCHKYIYHVLLSKHLTNLKIKTHNRERWSLSH